MTELTPQLARRIIEEVGSRGTPPICGFEFFTAGLEPYISTIDSEYLGSYVKQGGSGFKMVVGVYGGGKTHFLYCIRDLAWKHGFVVSYVSLKPGESPFHRLEAVYKAVVRGILPPLSPEELLSGYEQGIVSFLRRWFGQLSSEYRAKGLRGEELREALLGEAEQITGIESLSFMRAIQSAFSSLLDKRDEDFINICQWLTGENYNRQTHARYGILQRVDKTTAFTMLRSLVQWVRQIGFSGMVILLDEAERAPSLSTPQREQHLQNLREIIDECGQTSFQGVMIFYAVPDENFLQGRTQVYEALKQRLTTVFERLNPSGVKIELEKLVSEPIQLLSEVGTKLVTIYERAYDCKLPEPDCQQIIGKIAEQAYEERFGDIGYKRLFVQKLVEELHHTLRHRWVGPSVSDAG